MSRNLSRRVEAITPIEEPAIMQELQEILGVLLADNRHGWDLLPNGKYIQRQPGQPEQAQSAQERFMEMALASTHEGLND
jgi:polyphosphate kinase